MTREEAIYELKHTVGNINYDTRREEIYFTDKWVQAYEMAISVLREQEEKAPCEACHFFAGARVQDFGLYETLVFGFCPMCGRRLEEV